jgi:hypothetical protein
MPRYIVRSEDQAWFVVDTLSARVIKEYSYEAKAQEVAEMKNEEAKQAEAPKQEFEIRKKNKKATSTLKVDSQSHALAPQARENFFNLEKQWFTEDQNILDFKAVKNELESYTYQVKNDIDSYGPMEKFIEENTRVAFIKRL